MQKFHIVPAFRGFCVSGLNLSEVGHAMLKTTHKIWLSMATHHNVCHFMVQDREYTGFQKNTTTPVWKRSYTVGDKEEKEEGRRSIYTAV